MTYNEMDIRIRVSNIPLETRDTLRFKTYDPGKNFARALREAKNYAMSENPKHHFLIFAGNTGVGKTHLALAIAWHYLENTRFTVHYRQAQDLIEYLRSGFHLNAGEARDKYEKQLNFIRQVTLLIIDDLGAQSKTEWAEGMLDSIIDSRYIEKRRTVFTTNTAAGGLSARIVSRLSEGITCFMEGPDYRKKRGQELEGERVGSRK